MNKKIDKAYTLLYIISGKKVLLGMKKRGFGVNLWNGFGGKVEADKKETVTQAAIREMKEESGLDVANPRFVGLNVFDLDTETKTMYVHLFVADSYKGSVEETYYTLICHYFYFYYYHYYYHYCYCYFYYY